MKKLLQLLMLLSMVLNHQKNYALSTDDFIEPAVGIAALGVFIVTAPVAYLLGTRSSEAKRLEQDRLLLQEKNLQEKQQRREKSKRFLYEMQKKYDSELKIVDKKNGLNREEYVNRASARFNHKTPFIHAEFARELSEDIKEFSSYSSEYCDDEKAVAERIGFSLRNLFETHNLLFKNELAKELHDEKIALAEQQKRDCQVGIEKEKYQAAQYETERVLAAKNAIIELRNQGQSSIDSVSRNALANQNKMAEYAAQMHANNVQDHATILHDIRSEISSNGLRSLAQAVNGLRDEVTQVRREGIASVKEVQKLHACVDALKMSIEQAKNAALQAKNEGVVQKEELKKIFKKIDSMETALAIISADVGDIKSGNFRSEPYAPPRGY